MEGIMKKRCDKWEAGGKRNIIVFGALEVR
jgi:hypothetical protein